MTRRAQNAPGGMRRRWAALAVALLTAATVLVPVAGPASASGVQVPDKPSGLEADATAGSLVVSVDWDDVASATEYRVRWRRSGPGQALNDGLRPTSSETDITVADVGRWVVRVVACNTAGCGRPAAESFVTEPAPEPVPTTTTTTTTTVPVTTTTAPAPMTTTTVPVTTTTAPVTTTTAPAVESLAVAVSAAAEVTVGQAATLSADITGAPAGTPGYRWEMSYGGSWWFTLDSSATASYLASSPETVQFRVTVWYPSGESATSPTASVAFVAAAPATTTTTTTTTQPPAATQPPSRPTGLDADATAGSLDVSVDWDDMTGADHYTVQWRRRGAGHALNVGLTPTVSNATITVADAGRWVVRVQACNAVGCSTARAAGFETTAPAPPAAPDEFEVDADDGLAVKASWDDTQGATTYKLEWRSLPDASTLGRSLGKSAGNNGGLPGDSLQTATASATAQVAGAGMWQFLLSACNDGGCSAPTVRSVNVNSRALKQTGTDYDDDNDGLIEIETAAQFNAIRWDPDFDGVATNAGYTAAAAFPNTSPSTMCDDPNTKGTTETCNGYELMADIVLSGNWVPLQLRHYRGQGPSRVILEGNEHTIEGLTINSDERWVGLFDVLGHHRVQNLGIIEPDVQSRHAYATGNEDQDRTYVGALAGVCQGCVIDGVYVLGGSVRSTGGAALGTFHIGGLVGSAEPCEGADQQPLLDPCSSTGYTSSVRPVIANSYATASVEKKEGNGKYVQAGGLVGYATEATIASSYATGAVNVTRKFTSTVQLGGLAGYAEWSTTKISASYATGTVTFTGTAVTNESGVGGLVGAISNITVEASYSIGRVEAGSTIPTGGLIGARVSGGTVTNSYYNRETSGRSDTGKGDPKTTSELVTPTDYTGDYAGWNLNLDGDDNTADPWDFGTSDKYPGLNIGGEVHRPVNPKMLSVVAQGRTLALVYNAPLDSNSVPAAADFAVKVDDRAVSLARTNPVAVSGKAVRLTLASSVRAGQSVRVTYTKGTNPIRYLAGHDAPNVPDRAAVNAALTVQRAVIDSATGTTVTIELSEQGLQGNPSPSNWTYTVDGVNKGNPAGVDFDADAGTVTLTLSRGVNLYATAAGTRVTVTYRPPGATADRIRNQLGRQMAAFYRHELTWHIPMAACTLGPGPDPRNPRSPCGTGPEDRPGVYKDIRTMDDWDAIERTPDPGWTYMDGYIWVNGVAMRIKETPEVKFVDANNVNDPCAPSATACRVSFNHIETRFGLDVDFAGVYWVYLWADFKQDPENDTATCETRSRMVNEHNLKPNEDPWTKSSLSLSTPVPAGCIIEQWVAAVVAVDSGNKHSGAALSKPRDP